MVYEGTVKGKSVYLKSASLDDAQFTYDIRQDRERNKYMHTVGGTVENQREWLRKQMERDGDYFFVVHRNSGERIGTISIYDIDYKKKEGEAGRLLLNGNPIENMEAQYLLHEFAYNELKLESMVGHVFSKNVNAISNPPKWGSMEIGRRYNEEFGLEEVSFLNTKKSYYSVRDGIKKNIDRFASRLA